MSLPRYTHTPSYGGEGWGEEARFYRFPLSSVLSPLVPRRERLESLIQLFDRPTNGLYSSPCVLQDHNRHAVRSPTLPQVVRDIRCSRPLRKRPEGDIDVPIAIEIA